MNREEYEAAQKKVYHEWNVEMDDLHETWGRAIGRANARLDLQRQLAQNRREKAISELDREWALELQRSEPEGGK